MSLDDEPITEEWLRDQCHASTQHTDGDRERISVLVSAVAEKAQELGISKGFMVAWANGVGGWDPDDEPWDTLERFLAELRSRRVFDGQMTFPEIEEDKP